MDITWLGENSFNVKDELINIIINPTKKTVDSSILTEESVVLFTESDNDYKTNLPIVNSPGEYEINNASILGVANGVTKDQERSISTSYRIESRGLSVATVGMIGSPFDSEALSALSSSHIAIFSPNNSNIDSEILANTIRSIEPRKILVSGFDKKTSAASKELDSIVKVFGLKDFEPKNKVSITLNNLGDAQEIIILEN